MVRSTSMRLNIQHKHGKGQPEAVTNLKSHRFVT
jgi:hypothetical protein